MAAAVQRAQQHQLLQADGQQRQVPNAPLEGGQAQRATRTHVRSRVPLQLLLQSGSSLLWAFARPHGDPSLAKANHHSSHLLALCSGCEAPRSTRRCTFCCPRGDNPRLATAWRMAAALCMSIMACCCQPVRRYVFVCGCAEENGGWERGATARRNIGQHMETLYLPVRPVRNSSIELCPSSAIMHSLLCG